MSTQSASSFDGSFLLHMGPLLKHVSNEEFYEFCRLNDDLRIERTRDGDIVIMAPATPQGSRRNVKLSTQLEVWSERDGTGVAFDSSALFTLPNGAMRSPDASWVRRERWDALTPEAQDSLTKFVPDFVAELRSKTDRLTGLRAKMREYIECGVLLGWLFDPKSRRVEVYRPGQKPIVLDNPKTLSGDPELPDFVADVDKIWS